MLPFIRVAAQAGVMKCSSLPYSTGLPGEPSPGRLFIFICIRVSCRHSGNTHSTFFQSTCKSFTACSSRPVSRSTGKSLHRKITQENLRGDHRRKDKQPAHQAATASAARSDDRCNTLHGPMHHTAPIAPNYTSAQSKNLPAGFHHIKPFAPKLIDKKGGELTLSVQQRLNKLKSTHKCNTCA